MDTPQKTQIGTPGCNTEESPFSNFINNLSPINPSKNVRISHTLGSLNFTSPPSVFTSPHVNLQRESTFLRRHQVSELAKPDFSSDIDNKDAGNDVISPSKAAPHQEDKDVGPSNDEVSAEAPCETSNLTIELPRKLNYDCGSPDFQTGLSSGPDMKCEAGSSSSAPLLQEASRSESCGTQFAPGETDKSMDGSRCDWGSLIDATDLVVFESPQVQEAPKDSEEQLDEQSDLFDSLLSQYPEDNDVNDLEQQNGLDPLSSDLLHQSKDQISQPALANKMQQINQGQDNIGSSSLNGSFAGKTSNIQESKAILHRRIRRRCLVFEISGAKKNIGRGLISTSSQDDPNISSSSTQSVISQGSASPLRMHPGIGLHLNTLLASRGGRVLNQDNLSTEKQPITESSTSVSENYTVSSTSVSLEDLGNPENEVQATVDASQGSAHGSNEDLNPSSPKKKRRRPENSGEGQACKRCNCKKSKCLKLYCECFAAGVYCVEPCACRDCFNKPIHEETVLATRKQIESRNPLAFAPKVIKCSDSVNNAGDISNKTPASSRHKQGCNCKKSSCLKKYCECYQGGVGCSINCRCEGCKNTFGKKDGHTFMGMEHEVEEDAPANENSIADWSSVHNEEDLNPKSRLPKTPVQLFRSSLPLPSSSKGKPSRFFSMNSSSLLNHDGQGRSTFIRTQLKLDNSKHSQEPASGEELPSLLHNTSPTGSPVKTLSPNSKRISPPSLGNSPGPKSSSSRKLILQSIPSFPSLTPRR